MRQPISLTASLLLLGLAACSHGRPLDSAQGYGPGPALPPPQGPRLIPTIKIAKAEGWRSDAAPIPAADLQVQAFAQGLAHPRWLYVLPNGDVLVSEASGPADKDKGAHYGIRGWFQKLVMKKAGASPPSLDRITLLRDTDHDGAAETREVFLSGLHAPFGIALIGRELYVANTDGIMRFPYQGGETHIAAAGVKLTDLPGQPINHHWTKNILASPDGARLYASVGSNSNVAENGLDKEEGRAAIYQVDPATGAKRLYATGLRNPVGMGWEPQTGALWVAVNERDEIGDDLVPDYMTSVKEGGFYGWPYSYYGQHVDSRVKAQRPDLVARAIVPDYALGAHTASLGLTFYKGGLLPARYAGGAFIGQHGSWNRSVRSGYKVVFVPFSGGRPAGQAQDVLTGFLDARGHAQGRPVGVAVDGSGALLVADDVGNTVWRLTARP